MTDHENFPLTDYQRANLAKLANYLDSVEPPKFDMRWFNNGTFNKGCTGSPNVCGTVSCAVGHGPAAGIEPCPDDTWASYAKREFVGYDGDDNEAYIDNPVFDFLFDSDWEDVDNTPAGAAARIRYFLKNGIPVSYRFGGRRSNHVEEDAHMIYQGELKQ